MSLMPSLQGGFGMGLPLHGGFRLGISPLYPLPAVDPHGWFLAPGFTGGYGGEWRNSNEFQRAVVMQKCKNARALTACNAWRHKCPMQCSDAPMRLFCKNAMCLQRARAK
jgi:hypothetical protein